MSGGGYVCSSCRAKLRSSRLAIAHWSYKTARPYTNGTDSLFSLCIAPRRQQQSQKPSPKPACSFVTPICPPLLARRLYATSPGSEQSPQPYPAPDLLAEHHSVLESWRIFQATLRDPNRSLAAPIRDYSQPLFAKILETWAHGELTGSQLSPSKAFAEITHHDPSSRRKLWRLLVRATLRESMASYGNAASPNLRLDPMHACLELASAWTVALHTDAEKFLQDSSTAGNSQNTLFSSDLKIPSQNLDEPFGSKLLAGLTFEESFRLHFPARVAQTTTGGDSLLLATYAVLLGRSMCLDQSSDEVRRYQIFINYASKFISGSTGIAEPFRHKQYLSNLPGFSYEQVGNALDSLKEHDTASDSKPADSSKQSGIKNLNDFWSNLDDAVNELVAQSNSRRLERLWDRIVETQLDEQRQQLPAAVYLKFIHAFTSVYRPNRAVAIWNRMVQSGITPELSAWDALLRGFGSVRDVRGAERVWNMLIASGAKPDARLWTSRIASFSSKFTWFRGVEAFQQMTTEWLSAVQPRSRTYAKVAAPNLTQLGDFNGVPKPTVEALNAAVLGVARFGRKEVLYQLLSSASAIGVKPDVYTFNAIFRVASRSGDMALMSQTIQEMQARGIKLDIATFTMLLQSVSTAPTPGQDLPEDDERRSQAHQQRMDSMGIVLSEIEAAGLEANAHTFSAIVSGLLNGSADAEACLSAANAVIKNMRERGIPLSSHIYTSFIMAHFTIKPEGPDIAAVMETWNEASRDENLQMKLDEVFYDRLVEGFAKCNDTAKMETAMEEARNHNRTIGWVALTQAIQALDRVGDRERLSSIIEAVKREEQDFDRVRSGKGKRWFWQTARDFGFDDYIPTDSPPQRPVLF